MYLDTEQQNEDIVYCTVYTYRTVLYMETRLKRSGYGKSNTLEDAILLV